MTWSSIEGVLRVLGSGIYDTPSTTAGLCLGPDARDQDVDQMFGGPLTIGSQAYVRNTGERTQQVERIKGPDKYRRSRPRDR
jgi:hypothetical protein